MILIFRPIAPSGMPGRMIIFTSNYPKSIDASLLRHGRIDITIEFKKLSKKNVQDMYQLWFSKPIPQDIYDKMKDRIFTQANIGNLFSTKFKNVKNINKILSSNDITLLN